jgi:hypothetical protein
MSRLVLSALSVLVALTASSVQAQVYTNGYVYGPVVSQGYAGSTPFGYSQGGVIAGPAHVYGAGASIGPLGVTTAQGYAGPFSSGGGFRAVGIGGLVQAGQVNAFGRSFQSGTHVGPLGNTTTLNRIAGPNGSLNMIQRTNAFGRTNTFFILGR